MSRYKVTKPVPCCEACGSTEDLLPGIGCTRNKCRPVLICAACLGYWRCACGIRHGAYDVACAKCGAKNPLVPKNAESPL